MARTDFEGKTVVITGASRGLGAGIAEHFAQLGLRLGVCSRSRPALVAGEHVVSEQLDVRDASALEAFAAQLVERFGRIDMWINNAGVLDPVRFVRDLDSDALLEHLSINVASVLNGSRTFARHVRARPGAGVLINVSSGAALRGYAGWGCYCAGKAAVDRLSECIQLEEADQGLRVHAVAPGVIDTDMQAQLRGLDASQFPEVGKFLDLKRRDAFNTPKFVANALLRIAFDPAERRDKVVLRLPSEKTA